MARDFYQQLGPVRRVWRPVRHCVQALVLFGVVDVALAAGPIVAAHSNKCIDVSAASLDDGVQLIQYACHGGANQQIDLIGFESGFYDVKLQHSGKCLVVQANDINNEAAVVQGPCDGGAYTDGYWAVEPVNGQHRLVARHSGRCLNVMSGSVADAAPLIQWTCEGGLNETFEISDFDADDSPEPQTPLTNATNGFGALMLQHSGKCVTFANDSADNGAPAIQSTCEGAPSQRFRLESVNQNSFHIVAEHSGKCLNIEGSSLTNDARVVQWPCQAGGPGNDVFTLSPVAGGYQIIASHSGLCLNLAFGTSDNGGQLIQYACEGNNNEIFTIGALGNENGGQWSSPITFPLVPVAAGLMETGDILVWSAAEPMFFGGDRGMTLTATYHPKDHTVTERRVDETNHDMFCPGTTLMADGRFMVTGGSSAGRVSIFDPASNGWVNAPDMNVPRAYHSSAILEDGGVMVVGGSWAGGIGDKGAEVYRDGAWGTLSGVSTLPMVGDDPLGLYRSDNHMWLFTWTNNRIFQAGPSRAMHMISANGTGSVLAVGVRGNDGYAMNGSAVMYEPGKILTTGGAPAYDNGEATPNAHIIELTENGVTTRAIAPLGQKRTLHHSVVLPSGEVLVLGGQQASTLFHDGRAILTPELFDPLTEQFTPLAPSAIPRTYHSVALLMADARVFLGGGGLCGTGCEFNHPDAEIFTPPYLLNEDGSLRARASIVSAPSLVTYGSLEQVQTDASVSAFVLIRASSATHSVNTDQRRIPLEFQPLGASGYEIQMPQVAGIAPPGPYMLFALDADGVPSEAHMMRLAGE